MSTQKDKARAVIDSAKAARADVVVEWMVEVIMGSAHDGSRMRMNGGWWLAYQPRARRTCILSLSEHATDEAIIADLPVGFWGNVYIVRP